MPKPISQDEFRKAKKDRNIASGELNYFGGATNYTSIANKHFRTFAQRDAEENAKVRLEAHLEQVALKEKARINRAKSHTGHGMNWDILKEKKCCPFCERKLTLVNNYLFCDIHAGPPFRIGIEKLESLILKSKKL